MQRNKMMKSEKCKKQKKPRTDPGFDDNYFMETEYFFENGKCYCWSFTNLIKLG